MEIYKYKQILTPLFGIIVGSCGGLKGGDSQKNSAKFAASIDAQAVTLGDPISPSATEVLSENVVLGASATEVKNESSQDLPPSPDKAAGGTSASNPQEPTAPAAPPATPVPPPFYPAQCAEIKKAQPTAASGTYKIYLKSTDPLVTAPTALDAYCDMSEDGGGWTLLLNYVHKSATTPTASVRTTLPLLAGDELGLDESKDAKAWGHVGNAFLKQFAIKELRFYCRSSRVSRVIHFKTSDANCIKAATEGTGSCIGVKTLFTGLTGHTGMIPALIDQARTDRGDFSLTDDMIGIDAFQPIRWSIAGGNSVASWECDYGRIGSDTNTIHRAYFR